MRPTDPTTPALRRLIGLGLTAGLAGVALLLASVPAPPTRIEEAPTWWRSVGTGAATVALLRLVGIGLAGWSITVCAVGLIAAATRRAAARRLWRLAAPAPLRRAVAVSAVVAGVSAPGTALGAEPTDTPPMLRDLGRADTLDAPSPILTDLGPIVDTPPSRPAVERPAAEAASRDAVWVVERGDHLWSIAAETLADRGEPTSDAAVADYWRQLIARNPGPVGPDPDLIHPGAVLTLP